MATRECAGHDSNTAVRAVLLFAVTAMLAGCPCPLDQTYCNGQCCTGVCNGGVCVPKLPTHCPQGTDVCDVPGGGAMCCPLYQSTACANNDNVCTAACIATGCCAAGQVTCNGKCCTGVCNSNVCIPPLPDHCPNGTDVCNVAGGGAMCCQLYQSGTCADNDNICTAECIPTGCCANTQVTCRGTCCPVGETCGASGACCIAENNRQLQCRADQGRHSSQCCQGSADSCCGPDLVCAACRKPGQSCTSDCNCCDGTSCLSGICCPGGTTACNGACVNTSSDVNNCGACGHACGAGQLCIGGKCQCGNSGQVCCPGKICLSGLLCEADGHCHPCGALRGVCCANNTCQPGLTCVPSSPPQCMCGDQGQSCCSGNSCNPRFTCMSGVCGIPNQPPPQCVSPGGHCGPPSDPWVPTYCCPGAVCDYGTCKACINHGQQCFPGVNEICCAWQDSCVLDQFTGQAQCNIRN